MTTILIIALVIAGAIAVGIIGLIALALCRAASMGDEAMARFQQEERLKEQGGRE